MKELIDALNRWQAQYLVVGAHAVGVYTEPRSTKDLDIWVNPTKENAKRVVAAMKEFGAPAFTHSEKDMVSKDTFFIIGNPKGPDRIDILKDIPGVVFEECWKNRRTLDIGGTQINFPGLEDILKAKEAVQRPQDVADAEKLRKALEIERRQQQEQTPEPKSPESDASKTKPERSRGLKRGGPDHGPEFER